MTTNTPPSGAVTQLRPLLLSAEILLMAVTMAATFGFSRLFADNDWLGPMVVAVVVSHTVVALCRRFGRGLFATGAIALVAMVLQITWTLYRSSTTAGLPGASMRAALRADATEAWNLFGEVKAPTDSVTGFVVGGALAVWVIAYLADWAAFRLWSPLESIMPSLALFIFIAFFGATDDRVLMTALFLAALVGFQLLHRLLRQDQELRWLAGTGRAGKASLLTAGATLSAIAVLGAVAVGPALPGADEQAIVDLNDRSDGPSTRVVVSPIVDIRGRLVDQPNVVAFTVESSVRSYWRLASLDSFNGSVWGADNKYSRAAGTLPDDFPVAAQVTVAEQQYTIANMGAVWLPAAYEPRAVVTTSEEAISYEPTSGTLIVGQDLENSNGLQYTLISELPSFDPVALTAAPNEYPTEILDRYLDLPDDFSTQAVVLAQELTAEAETPYDKSLALQNFFRDNFTYSLEVGQGHSSDRIDQFLASQIGYCEQFAGSFAAMARAVGLPSRVAVGFTWGEQVDPSNPDFYEVRGEHAHAWPEVYIPGSGWVAFEPTPTRGAPGASQWTGVAPEQAGQSGEAAAEPTPAIAPTPSTPQFEPGVFEPSPQDAAAPAAAAGGDDDGPSVPGWLRTVAIVALAAVLAFGLYAAAVIGLKQARRQRRLAAADDARGTVGALWANATESLETMGLRPAAAETPTEFASRAGRSARPAGEDLRMLGSMATAAAFGPRAPDTQLVERAGAHHDQIVAVAQQQVDRRTRWRTALDPRPLFRR